MDFKKGKKNWSVIHRKGKRLAPADRYDKLYHGKWIEWDAAARSEKKK